MKDFIDFAKDDIIKMCETKDFDIDLLNMINNYMRGKQQMNLVLCNENNFIRFIYKDVLDPSFIIYINGEKNEIFYWRNIYND